MFVQPRLSIPPQALADFCRRNRIRHLGLFGSVLRDDFRPDSAMDVLVEFEPGAPVSLFAMVDIRDELSALVGRPVGLVPRDGLKPVIRDEVLASTCCMRPEVLYLTDISPHPFHPAPRSEPVVGRGRGPLTTPAFPLFC